MKSLRLVLLTTLVVCSTSLAHAQISDDVVKIGVLTDMIGPGLDRDRPGFGGGRADGGRRFRRQGAGQADQL